MASPTVRTTNDENMAQGKAVQIPTDTMSPRRVLGDVSPNVKVASPAVGTLKHNKPMAGSPLKRSFTAMVEEGAGFTYLKRRRLSAEIELSPVEGAGEQTRSVFSARGVAEEALRFRPLETALEDETDDHSAIPTVNEPSPTEPNTPSDGADSTHDSSAERNSFSSLINYDPSSQPQNFLLHSTSRAEMLKLRLRVAMYKVRTNQVNIPFAELKVEGGSPQKSQATSTAVEEAVASLRREAQQALAFSTQAYPKLLPAPVLKPTAYSSRMIYKPVLPSSPPMSRSPQRGHARALSRSTTTPQRNLRRLSSPPDSAARSLRLQEEVNLTSSVVKGRVAEGLLGLRNAV